MSNTNPLQLLRSSTANKRPLPAGLVDGRPAINTNSASPGLFFKDSTGALVKVGPVHVGTTAPNASPASGGATGNSVGEQWLDTAGGTCVFKVWDGTAWRSESGTFVDVNGDVMTGALGIIAGSAAAPGLYISGDTNTGLYSPGADQVSLTTGGTERVRIDSSGRLLVGGTFSAVGSVGSPGGNITPQQQLVSSSYAGASAALVRTSGGSAQLFIATGSSGSDATSDARIGGIYFNSFHTDTYYRAASIEGFTDTPTVGAGDMPGRLVFSTTADGAASPTERMRITSSGNVGIGNLNPSAPLSVTGTGTDNVTLLLYNGTAANPTIVSNAASASTLVLKGGAPSVASSHGGQIDLVGGIGATDPGVIKFRTGTGTGEQTERLRIHSDGATGIGTISGSSPRDAANFITSSYLYLQNPFDTNPTGLSICYRGQANGNAAVLSFDALATSGNAKTIAALIVEQSNTSTNRANGFIKFLVNGDTATDASATPTEQMRLKADGELLIGYTTDNGAYKLQVNSQIFATSATIATSDGRYKENVATLDGCLGLVKALRPVSFNWKPQQDIVRIDDEGNEVLVREKHNFPDGTQVGFIAQEVQEVLTDKPWLGSVIKQNVRSSVTDDNGKELAPEEKFLGIAEGNLIAVLTSALQEAIGRIENLEAEVAGLKAQ